MSVEIAVRHSFAPGSHGHQLVGIMKEFAGTIDNFVSTVGDEHIARFEVVASLDFEDEVVEQEDVLDFIEALRAHEGQAGIVLSDTDSDIPQWAMLIVPRLEMIFDKRGMLVHARCDYQVVGGFGEIEVEDEDEDGVQPELRALFAFAVGVSPVLELWKHVIGEGIPASAVMEHHIVTKADLEPTLAQAVRDVLRLVIEGASSFGPQAGPFVTIDEINWGGDAQGQAEELRQQALHQQTTLPTQWLSPITSEGSPRFGYIDEENCCRSWVATNDDELGELRSLSGWRHGNPCALMATEDGSYHIAVASLSGEGAGSYPIAVYAQRLSLEFETHESWDAVNLSLECDQVWGDHDDPDFIAHMAEHMAEFAKKLARNAFLRPTGVPRRLRLTIHADEALLDEIEGYVEEIEVDVRAFAALCPGENMLESLDIDYIVPKVVIDDGMSPLAVHALPKIVSLPLDLEERLDDLGDVEGEGWNALDLDPSSTTFVKGRWLTAGEIAGKPTRLPFIVFKSNRSGEVVVYSTLSTKKAPGLPSSLGKSMIGDLGTATLIGMMEAGSGIIWEGKAPARPRSKSRAFIDLIAKTFPDDRFSLVPFKQAYFSTALQGSPVISEIIVDARMPAAERRHVIGCLEEKPGRGQRSRIVTVPDVPWTPANLEAALGEMLADYAMGAALASRDGSEGEDFNDFLALIRGVSYAVASTLIGSGSPLSLATTSFLLNVHGSSSLADEVFRQLARLDMKSLRSVDDTIELVHGVLNNAMEADLEI
ncbi:conserved hypothetical protein [Hyphomicrobiales bacterium]|nr:conserved hypothetical protein [Hyphomicrobiales bacterium]CAH1702268.1 hypothetical protein BOSEA1005_30140 [Hyphomicrobiales bacterium]CAI0346471.1 conserved hypothetical protein [Hyphomicrobiales bacterium]